jgi:Cys-tRNA synthase (O-phospho-L-seryl-tRNA:Cys-tRNA synthase)
LGIFFFCFPRDDLRFFGALRFFDIFQQSQKESEYFKLFDELGGRGLVRLLGGSASFFRLRIRSFLGKDIELVRHSFDDIFQPLDIGPAKGR